MAAGKIFLAIGVLLLSMIPGVTSASEILIRNDELSLRFNDAENGFGCTEVTNRKEGASFLQIQDKAALWSIDLVNPATGTPLFVNNLTPCRKHHTLTEENGKKILRMFWDGIELPESGGELSVTCTITLPEKTGSATGKLDVKISSDRYAVVGSVFPSFNHVSGDKPYDLLFPQLTFESRFIRNHQGTLSGVYPGLGANIGYLSLFRPGEGGIYIGLRDPEAQRKVITVDKGFAVLVYADAIDSGIIGKARPASYEFELAAVSSPWESGRIYRRWAEQQKWMPSKLLSERTDSNPELAEVDVWSIIYGKPEEMLKIYRRLKQELPGKLVVHWYLWNVHPFDTHYPENLPAHPGFEKAVREIVENGDIAMPYINGHLWDAALPSFETEGIKAAVKMQNGNHTTENWGNGATLVPSCPYSPIYQRKIQELCQALIDMGVNAIYVDQIGQIAPAPCFDPTHGHPLGGGGWWQDGYRAMLKKILDDNPGKIFFSTENAAESYADVIAANLTWTEVYRDDFPSLMQVYGGKSVYFCNPSMENDDLISFRALQKRAMLWGVQPGWMWWMHSAPPEKRDEQFARKLACLNEIIAWRKTLRPCFNAGQLIDQVSLKGENPSMPITWHRQGVDSFTMPALDGTIWRSGDGRQITLILANISDQDQEATMELDLTTYGVRSPRHSVASVEKDGKRQPLLEFEGNTAAISQTVPAGSFRVLEITL